MLFRSPAAGIGRGLREGPDGMALGGRGRDADGGGADGGGAEGSARGGEGGGLGGAAVSHVGWVHGYVSIGGLVDFGDVVGGNGTVVMMSSDAWAFWLWDVPRYLGSGRV